jgi:Complex I intermediate-associated protein 30 (CIA30)
MAQPAPSEVITLEDFANPRHEWTIMNDPVMGGQSTGQFALDEQNGSCHFTGHVVDVPFLHGPGFIKIETANNDGNWPDISHCQGLQVLARSKSDYQGYKLSFGHDRPPHAFRYIYGYKANLPVPSSIGDESSSSEMTTIQVPFDQFSDDWDPATGNALASCRDDPNYCPSASAKQNLSSIAIWAEGVAGSVDLELEKIQAYGCVAKTIAADDDVNDEIVIEDFSQQPPRNVWTTMNDPVMGGKSTSSVSIHDGVASFRGTCANVPFLHAPGFITLVTGGWKSHTKAVFPDVSSCTAFRVTLRTNVDYTGYYLSFGTVRVPGGGHASGYKVPLDLTKKGGSDAAAFDTVVLPFTSFSSKWDEGTGKIQVKCIDDARYCPTVESLTNLETMSFWGEGVVGDVSLDIQSIRAVGCASSSSSGSTSVAAAALLVAVPPGEYHHKIGGNMSMYPLLLLLGLVLAVVALLFRRHNRRRSMNGRYEELSGHVEAV